MIETDSQNHLDTKRWIHVNKISAVHLHCAGLSSRFLSIYSMTNTHVDLCTVNNVCNY